MRNCAQVLGVIGGLIAVIGGFPPSLAQSTDPTFDIVNDGEQTVVTIYVRVSGDTNKWSDDWIGGEFKTGQRVHIPMEPNGECVNDIHIVFADFHAKQGLGVDTCRIKVVEVTSVGASR